MHTRIRVNQTPMIDRSRTNLLRQRDPVAAGAVLLDVGLELGVLLRRPRPFLHVRLVAARRPPHGSIFPELAS